MKEPNYYLTGGIYFALLLEARKNRTRKKADQFDGTTDQLSEPDVMNGFLTVFTGENRPVNSSLFKTHVSQYKSCSINASEYLPFAQPTAINIFNNEMSYHMPNLVERMIQFITTFLSAEKYEQLVKYLIELIINDKDIDDSTSFEVTSLSKIAKHDLATQSEIELPYFLLSIWQYIITNRLDNTKGQPTFNALFCKKSKNGAWILDPNSQLGKSISQPINAFLLKKLPPHQNGHSQHVKDDSTVDAEQVEPIVIEEKEAEPSQSLQIINKSTIIHQNGHNNINIEHLESLNL